MKTKKSNSKNIKKNFVWNTIGSGLYSFTSLFFMIIVTRINGVDDAGIFTFAFSFACMMQVIALYAGRTYQVTETDERITDRDYVFFKIFCCILMIIFSIGFIMCRGYSLYKTIIILILILYKALDAYAESFYGIFQKNDNLYLCGISLSLKAVLTTISFLISDLISKNLIVSLLSLLIIDIIIFICYDFNKIKKYSLKKSNNWFRSFKLLFLGGISVCIFYLLTQYIVNTQKLVIDFVMDNSNQTIFGIILMPATFMSLCTVFIFNPFTAIITTYIKNKKWIEFKKEISKILLYILIIGVFVIIVCAIIGIPILNIIYGISLEPYYWHLLIIVFGAIFNALMNILMNALISLRKNIIQDFIFLAGSIFSTFISIILINKADILGACLSYFFTMLFLLLLYIIVYNIELRKIINNE